MMPHAIRRVYVARRARSAASIAVWLMGVATIASAMSPKLAACLTRGMPGINPAILSTMVIAMWVLGIVAYFVARARCEHHFQVAISKTVLPSENADDDVERLSHENPDHVARDMAHRLEVRSSAWPVAAAAILLPATLLYVFYGVKAHGWPAIADYEQSLAINAHKLTFIAVVGSLVGVMATHRALRRSSGLLWLMSFGMVSLRKERAMLETDDPAAGSEMFTWRGFITSLTSTLEALGAKLNKRQGRIALVAGVAAVATLGFMTGRRTHTAPPKPAPVAAQVIPQQLFVNKESGSSYKVTPQGTTWRVDVTLTNDLPFEIRLPGISEIPAGWRATVSVRAEPAPMLYVGSIELTTDALVGNPAANYGGYTKHACTSPLPFGFKVKGEPGNYVLYITPVLEPADCG